MDERPWGGTDDEVPATPGGFAAAVFAEWITEDVVQRLYASRQDLAEAGLPVPGPGTAVELVRDRLLRVIGNLRELATRLRTSPEETSSPCDIARFAVAVAHECESARALIAQCAEVAAQDLRIRAEGERLARDGTRLQRAAGALSA